MLVPIGGGSGACGCCLVRTALGSRAQVIGVQAERADAFTRSWKGPSRVVGDKADTFAEGMATRVTFDLTFGILQKELDDIVTLSEDELAEGVRLALRTTHNLAEGAGAASLMAAMKLRDRLAGKTRRLRDERRQHRPRDAGADRRRVTTNYFFFSDCAARFSAFLAMLSTFSIAWFPSWHAYSKIWYESSRVSGIATVQGRV